MYPQADIPALQLSLQSGLAPDAHIAIGEALRDLQADKLLVIGSGFSFHNMSAFFITIRTSSLRATMPSRIG